MKFWRYVGSLMVVLLAVACGGSGGNNDVNPGDVGVDSTDAVVDVALDVVEDAGPELVPDIPIEEIFPEISEVVEDLDLWDPSVCGMNCPQGYCNEEEEWCMLCSETSPCNHPGYWCKEDMCVSTLCVPNSKSCKDLQTTQVCDEQGESYTEGICDAGYACHSGECLEVICDGGEGHCKNGLVEECAPDGTGWLVHGCPPGEACLNTECEPITNNLLVIFDTSGSMASGGIANVPCICQSCNSAPYPACEDPECPMSKLGMAKHVFNQFFDSSSIKHFNLVLTRFSLGITLPEQTTCNDMFAMSLGFYGQSMSDSSWIEGDDGSHVTEDGDWFDQNGHTVLCTPFPKTYDEDNLGQAKLWVNFNEEMGPTDQPCTLGGVNDQCPGGYCGLYQGQKRCYYHTDPELRAIGNTPLGRSMFYAGEFYRKLIKVDGRTCEVDADCRNRNYYCTTDGVCKDPFGHCRLNLILMFTDGVEEPPTSTSEFFNPQVQAKRFRYGLGCATNDDCFEGSECTSGKCGLYVQPNGGGSGLPSNTETPWRLSSYDGKPIEIITHVIDASDGEGAATNMAIADHGGGSYYHANTMDPEALLAQMLEMIDIKQNMLGCIPDWEGIPLPENTNPEDTAGQ